MPQKTSRAILSVILFAYVALGIAYALNTPKWQAPDEPAHFNYIRTLGDTGTLPILQRGDYDQNYLEQIKAAKFPATMPIDAIRYEGYQPPLYYLAATPIYLATRAGGLDTQVIALRLFSVALGMLILLIAFAILREIFPDDQVIALATVGLMASIPMHIAVTASISNDAAAELVLILIVWLAVKQVQHPLRERHFVVLGGILFGAALLTKTTAYAPGIAVLITAHIAHARMQNAEFRIQSWMLPLGALFGLAAMIALPMFARNALTYGITDPLGLARHDSVVIGQPTTAEMIAQYGFNHIAFDYFAVTFKSFWAQFGWMGVLINDRLYVVLEGLTGVAGLGIALYTLKIFRRRDRLTPMQWWSMGLLALLVLTAISAYIGYNFKFFQLQGRYLFPGLLGITFFLAIGFRELIAREYVHLVFVLLYLALLALDVAALFLYIMPQLRLVN